MNFVLIGEESLLIQCGQKLLDNAHAIIAVVAKNPQIRQWAADKQIQTYFFDDHLTTSLAQHRFDYLLSIANLAIIPEEVLALPLEGTINFHDGPLPQYAGLYTTSWAIINGESTHGVTWHIVETGIDTGNILVQKTFDLKSDESAFSLNTKCFEAGMATFESLLPAFAGGLPEGTPQNAADFVYYAKKQRPAAAATLDWSQPAEKLESLSRGLFFNNYENPLVIPKLFTAKGIYLVPEPLQLAAASNQAPGMISAISATGLKVATPTVDVIIPTFKTFDGRSLTAIELAQEANLSVGDQLPQLDQSAAEAVTKQTRRLVRYEAKWAAQLAQLADIEIPYARRQISADRAVVKTVQSPPPTLSGRPTQEVVAGWLAYLARLSGQESFQIARVLPAMDQTLASYFSGQVPVSVTAHTSWKATISAAENALALSEKRKTFPNDLIFRYPQLQYLADSGGRLPLTVGFHIQHSDAESAPALPQNLELLLSFNEVSGEICWIYDQTVYSAADIATMQQQLAMFLHHGSQKSEAPLAAVQLQSSSELEEMLVKWNATETSYDSGRCLHDLFVDQAAAHPQQTAIIFKNEKITYRELDQRSNQLAHHLQTLGVGPDTFVGVYMNRSIDMMVALFGILKSGGSYLPLDPDYPADRLAFMVEDTATPVILTENELLDQLPPHMAQVVKIDGDRPTLDAQPDHQPSSEVQSHHLSYIIYTSGSTGKPKGVMVEHRNVLNFFVGMDDRIPHQIGDVWLATTSLSFDISVLELFWTLTRGLTIVLHDKTEMKSASPAVTAAPSRPINFSLFYFASDASEGGIQNKYHLLMEGAKFADANGFEAVWTPERHFHAFGGLYPNPAVTGTAVAAVTKNVKIRAGSLVLPLHHPIRVTEEWSVLDNISNGRVGISFASGWQPNDFVLAPDNFANNKALMFEQIETVKKLWRGDAITFPGPKGDVTVQTLPRPVQKELPIWVTAAGNPETFRMAGAGGFYMLTHLLGQSVEDLAEKLAIYRQAWKEAGHPGEGHVTLMLHTFVGNDPEKTKEMVRPALKAYLRSAVFLIKQAAWSFPTFKQKATATGKTPLEIFESEDLTEEEMEALLEYAFERYYVSSGLLGTIDKCEEMVADIKRIGVDEVACQIDFGVPTPQVLANLDNLNELYKRVGSGSSEDAETDFSIPALIERHKVTHFQCTPSMMSMLLVDERMAPAMSNLQVCMLGGEALPDKLANQVVNHLTNGRLVNMYGPTETTIWSSTAEIKGDEAISIGRPIANTQLYVVDGQMEPVPVGVPGELLIGGDGVVRGYHNRPKLTAERFINNPFMPDGQQRVYRTGDLARFNHDGTVEFLGRIDFQVKIRGYRIELGEIESLLSRHEAVREAIVTAREDSPGDKRLVAYVIPQNRRVDEGELRSYLKTFLPEFMIPGHFIVLDRFPLTPNNKTDRKALPAPSEVQVKRQEAFAPPQNPFEQALADIWSDLLNLPQVGIHDNFFEIGGHSLLAVQAHRLIREKLNVDFSIADVFRYATIQSLSNFLNNQEAAVQETHKQAESRADARRQALGNRVRGRRRR